MKIVSLVLLACLALQGVGNSMPKAPPTIKLPPRIRRVIIIQDTSNLHRETPTFDQFKYSYITFWGITLFGLVLRYRLR